MIYCYVQKNYSPVVFFIILAYIVVLIEFRILIGGGNNVFEYIARKGDTMTKIANRFEITINALYDSNPSITVDDYIYPGQILEIPDKSYKKYVVQHKDTLSMIEKKFFVHENELIVANPHIKLNEKIAPGQIINIPLRKIKGIIKTNQEYSYDDLKENIVSLKQKYPFIQTEVIGSSVLGKNIYALRIGKGKRKVFYSGDWHANEHVTGLLLMKFIEDYAYAYSKNSKFRGYDITYLHENTSIWMVPIVNPDGVELVQHGITPDHPFYQQVLDMNNGSDRFYSWTANIRGVDLNHQWPAQWDHENDKSPDRPYPKKYGGTRSLTEPESIAIYQFTKKHEFEKVLAFHSQGQLIYWGFMEMEPGNSFEIANRLGRLSGYVAERTASSAAGYKDWFIQEYKKPGFTIEVGLGFNPLPITQFSQIYRENVSIMLEAPLL